MPSNSSVRFPNETAAYRDAREALLTAEMELRRKVEQVAALRLDFTPEGRGTSWYPKLSYAAEPLHGLAATTM